MTKKYANPPSGGVLTAQNKLLAQLNRIPLIRKEGKLMAGIALFIWSWVLVYSLTMYWPKHVSEAMVIIKDSAIASNYVFPVMPGHQDSYYHTTSSNAANPVLNTMGLLKSQTISEAMWQYFSTQHPEELEARHITNQTEWGGFFGNGEGLIKSRNQPGTDLISIEFSWSTPEIAQEGLGVVLQAFQEASQKVNRAEQERRQAYLQAKVNELSTKLAGVRQKKSAYKSQSGTVNIQEESMKLAGMRLNLETELNQMNARAQAKVSELKRYEQMIGLSAKEALAAVSAGQNLSLAKLQDQRYSLAENYATLRSTLTEKHPKVQEISAQLKQVDLDIQAELERSLGKTAAQNTTTRFSFAVSDPTRGNVITQMAITQAEVNNLQTQVRVLQTHLDEVKAKIKNFPAMEATLAKIVQEETTLSSALDAISTKALEAQVKEAEAITNVFVVDEPILPLEPSFPKTHHVLFIGFVLGILGGLATGLLKTRLAALFGGNAFLSEALGAHPENWPPAEADAERYDATPYVR